jgi:hypothetical protein
MAAQSDYPELRSVFSKNREVVKMLKAEKGLTDKQIYFTAVYNKLGKKINESKDKTSLTAFTAVINGRYQVCQPDSIIITWHNYETDEKLFEYTFAVSRANREAPAESTAAPGDFQGLGEVEVNNLVEKRLTEMRQKEEYERLKEEHGKMSHRVSELEEIRTALEHDIAAKETTESYMKIIGMALPGLSKIFGGASILQMLAGTDETAPKPELGAAPETKPRDEREEMIQMLRDYMQEELNQQEVATVYMLFMEIQKDKTLIQKMLTQLTTTQQ